MFSYCFVRIFLKNILDTSCLSDLCFADILPVQWVVQVINFFSFMGHYLHLCVCVFVNVYVFLYQKFIVKPEVILIISCYLLTVFVVLHFTSMIHFEVIFVKNIKSASTIFCFCLCVWVVCLHTAIQLKELECVYVCIYLTTIIYFGLS